jgi:hypothetical protein
MQIPLPSSAPFLPPSAPTGTTRTAQSATAKPADNRIEQTVTSPQMEAVKVSLRTTALAFSLPTLAAHQLPPACRPPMLMLSGVISTGIAADRASSTTGKCGNAADAAASILKFIPFAAAFPAQRLLAAGLSPAVQCGTRVGAQLAASAAGAVLEHEYMEGHSHSAVLAGHETPTASAPVDLRNQQRASAKSITLIDYLRTAGLFIPAVLAYTPQGRAGIGRMLGLKAITRLNGALIEGVQSTILVGGAAASSTILRGKARSGNVGNE